MCKCGETSFLALSLLLAHLLVLADMCEAWIFTLITTSSLHHYLSTMHPTTDTKTKHQCFSTCGSRPHIYLYIMTHHSSKVTVME